MRSICALILFLALCNVFNVVGAQSEADSLTCNFANVNQCNYTINIDGVKQTSKSFESKKGVVGYISSTTFNSNNKCIRVEWNQNSVLNGADEFFTIKLIRSDVGRWVDDYVLFNAAKYSSNGGTRRAGSE